LARRNIDSDTELDQIKRATKVITEKMQEDLRLFPLDNPGPFNLARFTDVSIIRQGGGELPTQKQVATASHPDVMKRNIADDPLHYNVDFAPMTTERTDGKAGAFVPISFGYYPNKSAWVRIAVVVSPRNTRSFDDSWPDEVQQSGPTHEVKLSVLNKALSGDNEFRTYMAKFFGVGDLDKVLKNQKKFLRNIGASMIQRDRAIVAEQFPHIGVF